MRETRLERSQKGFDYKVFSESGKTVVKETKQLEIIKENYEKLSVMAGKKETINLKIERFLEGYDLEALAHVDDIEKTSLNLKR